MIALNTGMRRGEILKLKVSDLDFYRGEILVTQTKIDEDRSIPMNDLLRSELSAHCQNLSSEHVFCNPRTGKPITDIKKAFATLCKNSEIDGLRFHDLRHTAATRMGERGIDPFTIAEIMGHKDVRTTVGYTHATREAKRRAVAALEGISRESGPQMGHKHQQRPMLAAAK